MSATKRPRAVSPAPAAAEALRRLLAGGEVRVKGRMPWSSNATFLVELGSGGGRCRAIYKPVRGERPLWDFPPGLHRREIAAYVLSEALGWGLVPPTVAGEGPLGEGSFQLFVDADFEQHYFTLREDPARREELQRICAFDVLANNADRKGGHCLVGRDGRLYAIDNGLTFHAESKLRTVIWDFGGEPLPGPLREDVRRVANRPWPAALSEWLDPAEEQALTRRARALAARGTFPEDRTGHRYPWPLV